MRPILFPLRRVGSPAPWRGAQVAEAPANTVSVLGHLTVIQATATLSPIAATATLARINAKAILAPAK